MTKLILFFSFLLFSCQSVTKESSDQNTYANLNSIFQLGVSEEVFLPQIIQTYPKSKVAKYTGSMASPYQKQTQINAKGVLVFGKERDVEFLFNDGVLGHIWIFYNKEELESIKAKLTSEFGEIEEIKKPYYIFKSKNIAVRTDPYEILLANPTLLSEIIGL